MHTGESERQLVLEGSCPECGGPYQAGIWDHSHPCEFCGSLLLLGTEAADQVFVVTDGSTEDRRALEILVRQESAAYEARLLRRLRDVHGLTLEIPALVERRVGAHRRALERSLDLLASVDFFAPYRIVEGTIVQGILGRRRDGPKESFLQVFQCEELERLYDPSRYRLRDRGLKIRGLRATLLREEHLELARGRFLPIAEPESIAEPEREPGAEGAIPPPRPSPDRARTRIRADTQIVSRVCGRWRERALVVYKHLTYAAIARAGREEHYLFDRQWGSIAARLEPREAELFRSLPAREIGAVVPAPRVRAVASECPDCGWEMRIPRAERVSFCPGCRHAVQVTAKGLRKLPYRAERAPDMDGAESLLYFPFWAFSFRVRVGTREFHRVRDWIEAVSPGTRVARLEEPDPDPSHFFIPARSVYGTPELDRAYEALTGHVNWRQPKLSSRRPLPDDRARLLGAELDREEAAGLARFSLLALHDNASTRRLNGRVFKAFITDAELHLGEAVLAMVPLSLRGECWRPEGISHAVPRAALEADPANPRTTRSYGLR